VTASLFRQQAVFGAADGVTIALGLLVTLTGEPHALVRAAVGAGVAELVGMTAGAWLSDEKAGFLPALANGTAALLACLVPALPYLAGSGWAPVAASVVLVGAVAGAVALLRPERGALAFVQTFGILAVAALACAAASAI
jgi:hypothetical protein